MPLIHMYGGQAGGRRQAGRTGRRCFCVTRHCTRYWCALFLFVRYAVYRVRTCARRSFWRAWRKTHFVLPRMGNSPYTCVTRCGVYAAAHTAALRWFAGRHGARVFRSRSSTATSGTLAHARTHVFFYAYAIFARLRAGPYSMSRIRQGGRGGRRRKRRMLSHHVSEAM